MRASLAFTGINLLMDSHNGYLDKLRVTPINRLSILFGEMAPLFLTCAIMASVILRHERGARLGSWS